MMTRITLLFLCIAIALGNAEASTDTYWVCCESAGGEPGCKKVTGNLDTNSDCETDSVLGRVRKGDGKWDLEKTFKGSGASHRVSMNYAACDDEHTYQVTKESNSALVYQCDKGYEALTVKFDSDYY